MPTTLCISLFLGAANPILQRPTSPSGYDFLVWRIYTKKVTEMCESCSGVLNLAPYLFVIPRDLAPFRQLFVELGVRAAFSPAQFVSVLEQLHADGKDQPLQPAQLEQALAAVQARSPSPPFFLQFLLPTLLRLHVLHTFARQVACCVSLFFVSFFF